MSETSPSSAGIDANILETLYQLSQRYHGHGLYGPASRLLDFLLRHDPMRAGYHFALGKALHGDSRHSQAVLSYRHAMKLGLPDIDVHLYLGQCLIFVGRFVDAAAALRQFLGLARLQAPSESLALHVRRASHLLDQIVTPRLRPAEKPRPASAPAASAARTRTSRHPSKESTR